MAITPSQEDFQELLAFLEIFEHPEFDPDQGGFLSPVCKFASYLHESGWACRDVDCREFNREANEILAARSRIETADLETVQKLFRMLLWWEHFGFASLEGEIENGLIQRLLRRIAEIRSEIFPSDKNCL